MRRLSTILASVAAATAATLSAGLVYRRLRQRRVAQLLAIATGAGIVEERFIRIGGIDQWIQIRGENRDNPVLLMLHGGPGWPNAVFNVPLRSWEQHFTVVQWDQRGAGKTFGRSGKSGSGAMTFDCRVADAIELVEFLCRHLGKQKLVLLAESMGTLTGVPLAKARPDLFSAIVVTDLYVNMVRNEALKYQQTLRRLRKAGNRKAVATLERIGADPTQWDLRAWNLNMAWAFKTNVPTPNLERALLLPLLLSSPLYTLRDICMILVGFQFATARMHAEFRVYDARRWGPRFEVPFVLLQGESDVITMTSLAQEYFAEVEAPTKQFALIRDAGHFAAFTQPAQFLAELLRWVRPIAVASSQ